MTTRPALLTRPENEKRFPMISRCILPLLLACLAMTSCSESPAGGEAPAAAAHAPANVVPGSHEDWCVEHEVPESRCTRCDPGLVAAFKATGDWCGEHGLPESQCVTCDPARKQTRPPQGDPR